MYPNYTNLTGVYAGKLFSFLVKKLTGDASGFNISLGLFMAGECFPLNFLTLLQDDLGVVYACACHTISRGVLPAQRNFIQ